MKKVKNIFSILKCTFYEFSENDVPKMSAALAYFTFFALAPLLLVIITVCDIFYGRDAIEGTLFGQIKGFVGNDAALQIQEIIKNAAKQGASQITTIVSIVALVFSATGVFTEIQSSINAIWQLKAKPKKGWLKFLTNRLLSLSMVFGLGFILMVSLVLNAFLDIMMERLMKILPDGSIVFTYIINFALTFIIISSLFGIIFKFLPDAKILWKDVRAGAFTTAILFMLGKFAISLYLGKSNPGGTYGTAGSIVIILLWVYYSSIILYFGACFTKANAHFTGRRIMPNDYAVFVKHIEVQNHESLQEQEKKVIEKT